jgi:hypothetical protein
MSSTLGVRSVVASAFCVLDRYTLERFGQLRSTHGEGASGVSPVDEEGWPEVQPEDRICFEGGPIGLNGWPDLLLPSLSGILVTTMTTIEKEDRHSACRLLCHSPLFSP